VQNIIDMTMKLKRFSIALNVLALLLVALPYVTFAANSPSKYIPCGFDLDGKDGVKDLKPPLRQSDPHEECYFDDAVVMIQTAINFLIFDLAAPLGMIMFAYAGFLYVTNQGNESQIKEAHGIFANVLIGLVVALAAWVIVNFVATFFLGADSAYNFLRK
jgi:hypothetical protein